MDGDAVLQPLAQRAVLHLVHVLLDAITHASSSPPPLTQLPASQKAALAETVALAVDDELVRLCGAGIIDEQTAELYSVAPESIKKRFISR